MIANFKKALDLVLESEGGYVNDPHDPGGATNLGITQAVYDAYRRNKQVNTRSVKILTANEVEDIYRQQYWDRIRGDNLPSGVDYVVFDAAVNSGVTRATKWLQQDVGVKADGVIGAVTLAAVRANAAQNLIDKYTRLRLDFLMSLKTWKYFGKGWRNRVIKVQVNAKEMT